jgi:hypothetical protein
MSTQTSRPARSHGLLGVSVGMLAGWSALTFRTAYLHWGAATHETTEPLPGDELIPAAGLVSTRAVTIEAPPERVWPWVAQLGQGRGGFYSYDALENLAGCDIQSAETIEPAWQHPQVGDEFRLHPQVVLHVASVDPGRSLVVEGRARPGEPAPPYDFTWSFVVQRHPHLATRLLVRERYGYTHRWSPLLVEPLAAVSALMSRKMLRGIRDRAERNPAGVATGPSSRVG